MLIGTTVAAIVIIVCVALITAMFVLFKRVSRPSADPVEDLFREFMPRPPARKRGKHFTLSKKKRSTADEFEEWFNEALARSAERMAQARAQFEEQLRSGYQATPQTKSIRPWRLVLGVEQSATLNEARAAFRKIAKETHPESAGANADLKRFQDAVEAYDSAQRELKS